MAVRLCFTTSTLLHPAGIGQGLQNLIAVHLELLGHGQGLLHVDMEEALAMTKQFQMDRYQVLEALANTGGMQ